MDGKKQISRLLVANRGEIARRVFRTARRLGVECLGIYSDADQGSAHVLEADRAMRIGPAEAVKSYLSVPAVLDAAKRLGADAIHPGYGFLSENASFARACATEGIIFVGPPVEAIEKMGSKSAARQLMSDADVPVIPGYDEDDQSDKTLLQHASRIGYPVLIKPVMGGGGKGMRIVRDKNDFIEALQSARAEAASSFGDARVLLEKYIERSRHIEVQVFGDQFGNHVHLWERDCSIQRRHQKIIEEAPAPGISSEMQKELGEAAVAAAKKVGYSNAGTVEFILDVSDKTRKFYFLEMNTRLQVEHPVSEIVSGQDLVEWQIRVANGEKLPITDQDSIPCLGHAIEARIYAESPRDGFLPQAGTLERFQFPGDPSYLRVDAGVREKDEVGVYYDPMIAKVIVSGDSRETARSRLVQVLRGSQVIGVSTNAGFASNILCHEAFRAAKHDTSTIEADIEQLLAEEDLAPSPPGAKALAALAIREKLMELASSEHPLVGPFSEVAGFHVFGNPQTRVRLDDSDVRIEEKSAGVFSVFDGKDYKQSIAVHSSRATSNPGEYVMDVTVDGSRFQATCFVSDSKVGIYAFGNCGKTFETQSVDEVDHSLDTLDDADSAVKAPLPGRVKAVLVSEGDLVEKGSTLLSVEAMKMIHSLRSPMTGRVTQLQAREGEVVGAGEVLLVVHTEATD